jgi:hypothetical protein
MDQAKVAAMVTVHPVTKKPFDQSKTRITREERGVVVGHFECASSAGKKPDTADGHFNGREWFLTANLIRSTPPPGEPK